MDIFPAELAMRIIEGAAFDFRFSVIHRQSVVHLASTSHTVYAVVAPILYHTLLINSANEARIRSLMFDEQTQAAAVRMCSYVRVLHFTGPWSMIRLKLLTSLEHIHARGRLIRALCEQADDISQHYPLRHITTVSPMFSYDMQKLAVHARARLTHVCGFLPVYRDTEWSRMQDTPVLWAHEILNALPGLTHFGLVLVNVESLERSNLVSSFRMESLRIVVQTALRSKGHRLQQVALRVGGRYIEQRRGDIEEMVRQIDDDRLRVWWDERQTCTWNQWYTYDETDLMEGRDIWTEAREWP